MSHLLMCDRQQSVLGAANTVRSYSAYGALSAITGPSLAYCGQHRDPLKGIYHLGNGHRSFDPALMRFLSPDALSPFGAGGVNAYAYCTSDPINHHDRSGRMGVSSLSSTFYAAGKGVLFHKHWVALGEIRKNGAGLFDKSIVATAMVLDVIDLSVESIKGYFGLSLHSNREMTLWDDPLFETIARVDLGIKATSGVFDVLALDVARKSVKPEGLQVQRVEEGEQRVFIPPAMVNTNDVGLPTDNGEMIRRGVEPNA
ncbi:RHS repeat-associated core domain-containing protein [Pseudomonas carassii]|uniref:RHS repeat-associated core domain-containing protein n=1 Tax=Pseudomonas carassii TaxID=3115855 RepID=A0ABU7HGH5_9PSED|nr:RHS repeat-associated core domain-containing protein [Pseudomonas sp. 137P]MEE1890422.1 RHS repeat-associated core domain-containing protein [Pseudomonas sp. 137P]